jgi:predicted permease
VDDALRDGGRHGGGRRLRRVLNALVVVEVALSLVLLAGAGLLIRSFVRLQNVDPGFRADGVLTAQVQLPPAQYDARKIAEFFKQAIAGIAALPGVRTAAGVACVPLAQPCIGTSVWRIDRPAPEPGLVQSSAVRPVTPASFAALAIPQVAGRDFGDADTVSSTPVAVVSESFVRLHFGRQDPLGVGVHINNVRAGNGRIDNAWTIVGVVRDIKGSSLEADVRPTVYVPHAQLPTDGLTLLARTDGDPAALANAVARVVHGLDPEVPVSNVRTLADVVGATIARPRAVSVLVGAFALVALVLAAVGVYGVMAYVVVERTQEIGVRMALGASAAAVFRLVLGQALQLVAIGIGTGLLAAAALTRVLGGLLFETGPLDPWTFAATTAVLASVATVASYVPARRGMRTAPVEALRTK